MRKKEWALKYPSVRADYANWPKNQVMLTMVSPADEGRDFVLTLESNDAYRLALSLLEQAHEIDLQRIREAEKVKP